MKAKELSFKRQGGSPERDKEGRVIVRLGTRCHVMRMEGPCGEFFEIDAPKRVRMYFESDGDNFGPVVPDINFYQPRLLPSSLGLLCEMEDLLRKRTGHYLFVWDVYLDEVGL